MLKTSESLLLTHASIQAKSTEYALQLPSASPLLLIVCMAADACMVLHAFDSSVLQVEEHMVDGKMKQLLVHRKGSTRAFPPHHPLIPVDYQLTGQPVLIGGTMGTNSYVLTGASLFNLDGAAASDVMLA